MDAADPAEGMRKGINNLANALEETRPIRVLAISDYGAHVEGDIGMPTVCRGLEKRLARIGGHKIFLRSAEHMQGWERVIPAVKESGTLPTFHSPVDKLFPTISAPDLGPIAARLLLRPLGRSGVDVVHAEAHNRRLNLRFAQPQGAAMASSTTNPPAAPDPFDLGIHTPANLNRGARAALLQNSPAAVNGTIGVSPGPRRMAQTPSSPLSAATIAAATEGAAHGNPSSTFEQQPVSIIESANDLARERIEEYNAKLMVFQAFCAKFEEAAQQFTTGPHRLFAQQFADSFLDSWKRDLSSARPTIPKPTYSSVAAASPRTDRDHLTHRQQQQHGRRQTDPPHRQGQQTTIAPPRQDLRVFIRLEAGAPARAHSGYAIRTLIREKLGAVAGKIRQVFQVRSGWAVLAADSATRDFLVDKQAEWAAELGATAVETNKEWFTYVVSDVPTRLSDFYGNEVDSDSVVSDEIEIQTGLKPIDVRTGRQFSDNPLTKALLVSFLKPTKRFWSLFGSSAARLVDKTDRPRQCEKCWGHHFARNCHRQPVCRRCGETGHLVDDCIAPEQCVNCLGPHQANFRPLVRRHTDNDTKNHSRDRIRKPSRAWLSDKTRMSHHKNDRTLVLQAQLYQEHLRASWWPRPLMLAMKQRKNPNSPNQAHRESAE
ncbi:hypothetical protein FOXYSP1_19202 [Fusarium oxysporum f. sp. phaseoli]